MRPTESGFDLIGADTIAFQNVYFRGVADDAGTVVGQATILKSYVRMVNTHFAYFYVCGLNHNSSQKIPGGHYHPISGWMVLAGPEKKQGRKL
ncbi:MAG: hypothetical protein WA477_17685 [Candidatus Sulfotelmatobacter sp.]